MCPSSTYLEEFRALDDKFKEKQRKDYDKHNRTHDLEVKQNGTKVWITVQRDKVGAF